MSDRAPLARRGPWVLAVDVGTSSVRAGWVDAAGTVLSDASIARAEHAWRTTPDGGMETDGEALLALCLRVIDQAVKAGREAGVEPAAVSVAAFWHGWMGIGADGR